MYYGNFIGYYISKGLHINRVIWNIRHSNLDTNLNKKSTLIINKICAKLSRNISAIAYNGEKAREVHIKAGYSKGNDVVLANGVDCTEFCFLQSARKEIRTELHIGVEDKIVLSVARNHPIKDVPSFVKAFAITHKSIPNVVAVMCGRGIDVDNLELQEFCRQNELMIGKDIYFLGLRHDIAKLMSACDLYVLHSAGEAFPNTLVQAMSCGCVCVSTDVGDAKSILNRNDFIVEPGQPLELAEKMKEILAINSENRYIISEENRRRAVLYYDIKSVVKNYEKLYEC